MDELESDKLDLVGIGLDDAKWFDPVKSIFAGHTGRVLDVKVENFIQFSIFITAGFIVHKKIRKAKIYYFGGVKYVCYWVYIEMDLTSQW